MKKSILFCLFILFVGIICVCLLPTEVNAASASDLAFTLNDDGKSYGVTYCNSSASGSLTIPDTYKGNPVTSIGASAFDYCSSLTSITIPNSVTSIGDYAFEACSSLTSITIPNSVTSIGFGAFSRCSSLESISIPFVGGSRKTASDTYQYPFGYIFGTSKYTGTATTQSYYGRSTSATTSSTYYIPTSLKFVTVTGGNILCGAFSGCSSLTSITIPNSVTSIGDDAFHGCRSLTSISIPNSVTSIGWNAFENCTGLTSITIPNSVTSIGWGAFSGCSSLESISIPFVGGSRKTASDTYQYPFGYIFGTPSSYTGSTVITQYYYGSSTSDRTSSTYYIPTSLKFVTVTGGNILYGAFYGCSSLTSISIPNSVTSIGATAFCGCSSLTSISIPNSVTSIGSSAFSGCSGLTSISIPNSVTSIGSSAFGYCSSLTSITIPNSVTSIGDYAFRNCTGLTSISIPNSVTSIGRDAFYDCSSLTSITIPNSVTSIGNYAFRNCSGLTSISIPNSVTSIGSSAFDGCSSLTSISIPNSVTSIGSSAFKNCTSLTSIIIPNSVTTIERAAFEGCSALQEITIPFVGKQFNGVNDTFFGAIFSTKEYRPEANGQVPESIKKVTITGGIQIDADAFYNCNHIKEIIIAGDVRKISTEAFENCKNLQYITIPQNVINISTLAFYNCNMLTIRCVKGSAAETVAKRENIPIEYICNEHNWGSETITKPTSCKEPGEKTYTCSNCDVTKTESIAKLTAHTYDHACDTDCNICGATRTITHNYKTAWSKDQTNHWRECTVCEHKNDMAVHIPGAEATETTAQTCTTCGYIIRAALNHEHNFATTWTTDDAGHWYACSGCAEKSSYATHDFENDCDKDCSICGFTRETEHKFAEAWTSDATNHWHVCSGCGLKQDEATHEPGAEATATTAQTCTICGYEIAPALGGEETTDPTDATTPTTPTDKNDPDDGSFPWWIIIIVAVVAIGGVVAVIVIKKKK